MLPWDFAVLLVILCVALSAGISATVVYLLVYRGTDTNGAMSAAEAEQYITDVNRAAREAIMTDVMRRTQQPRQPTIDGQWS